MRVLPLLVAAASLAGCATTGTVKLNADKAFLTAQIAFLSAQQTTLAVCSGPFRPTAACDKAIDLLHTGAAAESAGYAARQTANDDALTAAILTLTNLPPQLVALGILKAN